MSENQKRKVGRPKGSKSFVEVTLADVQKIAGPATIVPIGRIWWEKMGGVVTNSEDAPVGEASNGQVQTEEAPAPIEFTIEE